MWLKPLIAIVIFLIFVSLFSSLFFLFKDQGQGKRSVYSLGFRVTMAALLLILVSYGLYTGELGNKVPWGSWLKVCIQKEITLPKPHQQSANTKTLLQTQNGYEDQSDYKKLIWKASQQA